MSCFRPPKKKPQSPKAAAKSPRAAAKQAPPAQAAPAKAAPAKAAPAPAKKAAEPARNVPENILKKSQRDAKLLKHFADARAAAKAKRAASRTAAAAAATKYAKEYADADKALIDAKRAAKKNGDFYVEAQAKIAFIVRTRG